MGGSVHKLIEKMEFWGLCTAVHTVWNIGGFFFGSARKSGAHLVSERERERRSRKFYRARAALVFLQMSASASGARKIRERLIL